MTTESALEQGKQRLEAKLADLGIDGISITHLPYLDASKESFQTAHAAGARMMILYALAYATHNVEERAPIVEWLKGTQLWDQVSPEEALHFEGPEPDEIELEELAYRFEGAYVLAWALNLVHRLPAADQGMEESDMEAFMTAVPEIGAPIGGFLESLSFRDLNAIYEENLLNELITGYFRDQMLHGEENMTAIDPGISYERHFTLNWLRNFEGISQWDEISTST